MGCVFYPWNKQEHRLDCQQPPNREAGIALSQGQAGAGRSTCPRCPRAAGSPASPWSTAAEKQSPQALNLLPTERGTGEVRGAGKGELRRAGAMEEAPLAPRGATAPSGNTQSRVAKLTGSPQPAERRVAANPRPERRIPAAGAASRPPPATAPDGRRLRVPRLRARPFRGSQHPLPAPVGARPPVLSGEAGLGELVSPLPSRTLPARRRHRTSGKLGSDTAQGRGKLGARALGVIRNKNHFINK